MKNRLEGLNFIRIFATILILLFHAKIYVNFNVNNIIMNELIRVGAIGCTVFFMLSGFGLRQSYSDLKICNKQLLKQFYVKRIIALYPAYLVLLIVALYFNIKTGVAINEVFRIIPIQLTLVQTIFYPKINAFADNANFWFISALFVLYILFPFLNEVVNNIKLKYKIVILFLLIFVSQYFYYINISLGNEFVQYYTSPVLRIPEFFCGILISDIAKEEKIMKHFKGIHKMLISIVFFVLLIHYTMPIFITHYNLYNIIVIPFTALLIFCMVNADTLNRIGSNKIIKYISSLGLLIYLCQEIAIHLLFHTDLAIEHSYKSYIIITILSAIVIHELIEKPFIKLLRSATQLSNKNL